MSRQQQRKSIRPVEDPAPPRASTGDESGRPGIDQLREIVGDARDRLLRWRRVFAVVAGGVGALLLGFILTQTALFEATSLLLVKFGRELVYQTEVGAEQSLTARDKETMINSELAILRSRPVLLQVVRSVGLPALYPDLAEAVQAVERGVERGAEEGAEERPEDPAVRLLYAQAAERLGAALSAQALPETDVLSLSFQHPDPFVAERTVEEVVSRFLAAHVEAYGEPEIVSFLDQRVSEYERRLDASEKRLQEFETEHAAFALESPQTTLMQWRDETLQELAELENRVAAIRMGHLEDDAVAAARNTLMNLQLEVERLQGDLKRDAEERIVVVRRFIAQRKAEVEREVSTFEEKRGALLAKVASTERELKEFPSLSAEYRALRRERDADEEQYATYRRRLRDARLSADMDQEKIASISIIQPASAAPDPVWPPSKSASIPLAFVLSMMAGGFAVLLVDRFGGTSIAWLDEEANA